MNAKRWIAVWVALALLLISVSVKSINHQLSPADGSGILKNLFSESLTEQVLYDGNKANRIAVLYIDGVITSYVATGLFSSEGYNHALLLQQIKDIKNDDTVKGVLLSVNSPGGGTFESAQLKDALRDLQKNRNIPIYVSMQNMAASGGYYISAYADKIFAAEETITGSIGVIMSGRNLSGLYEKLGIQEDTIKSGAFKDMGSESRPMTQEDRKVFQDMIDLSYQRFLKVVAEGRRMDINVAKKLADGRIYDGAQAKANGLVDEIGYFEDCLAAMQKDQNLSEAEVFYYDSGKTKLDSLLGLKLSSLTEEKNDNAALVKSILTQNEDTVRPMYLYRGGF